MPIMKPPGGHEPLLEAFYLLVFDESKQIKV
jgi:hypothetical protein